MINSWIYIYICRSRAFVDEVRGGGDGQKNNPSSFFFAFFIFFFFIYMIIATHSRPVEICTAISTSDHHHVSIYVIVPRVIIKHVNTVVLVSGGRGAKQQYKTDYSTH